MSRISQENANRFIGEMNRYAYYSLKNSSNNPETPKEKEKREKKRIKE